MKILKKLLLIGLCSFAFVVNASAETRDIQYQDTLKEWIIENEQLLDNVAQYFKDNASIIDANHSSLVDITNDKNVLYYPNINFSNNQIVVGVLLNYETNSNYFQFYNNTSASLTFYYKEYVLNYDSSTNEILGISSFKTGNTSSQISTYDNVVFDDKFFDWRLGKNTDTIIKNNSNYDFILNSNNDIFYNNTTFDGTFYNFVESLNYGLIESDPEENVCTRTAVLGAVSNVNEIKLNVKGDTSVFYPLKGTFTLNYTSVIILSEENFSVDFVNNSEIDVVGNYTFKCATDSNNCYLNYEYSSMDDIIETIDFSFKIRSSDNGIMPLIKIYACTTNDDYTYISYDYTNGSSDNTSSNPSIENILTDSTLPDLSGLADTSLIGDGPVDSILLLPLNIMNTLLSVLNSNTCRPLVLPLPFVDNNLTLPCISTIYSQIDGLDVFLNWFSAIFSAFILYEYFIRLYKWVDDVLTLRENNHFGGF